MNIGQTDVSPIQHGRWWTIRVRHSDGGNKRVRVCPVKGPGSLDKEGRKQRVMQLLNAVNHPSVEKMPDETKRNITLRIAAEEWLRDGAVKGTMGESGQGSNRSYVEKWIAPLPVREVKVCINRTKTVYPQAIFEEFHIPILTDLPLSALLEDGDRIAEWIQGIADHIGGKTVKEVLGAMKQIVEHLKEAKTRQPMFKWLWKDSDLDVPEVGEQARVAYTAEQVAQIIAKAEPGRYKTLYSLLGSAPLRFAEVLALKVWDGSEKVHGPNGLCIGNHSYISEDCKTLYIRKQVRGHEENKPKTPASVRDIDLPPQITPVLKAYIGERKSGFVFETENGTPLLQRNVLRDSLHPIMYGREEYQSYREVNGVKVKHILIQAMPGVAPDLKGYRAMTHAFRRFVIGYLRVNAGVPQPIVDFWSGHKSGKIQDVYTRMATLTKERREWADKAGVGYKLAGPKVVKKGKAA